MSYNAKINEDDVQFVEATVDEEKRQERIERLSRTRRLLYRLIMIQGGGACFSGY